MKDRFLKALEELRKLDKEKPRKFNQSVDLIVNLKNIDIRRDSINTFVELPHKARDVKICAFLERPSKSFDFCITKAELGGWQDKKEIKRLAKEYDFFVALASLMPQIATKFGKFFGPAGKMPSPQLGILPVQDEKRESELSERMKKIIRVKAKEPSIKIVVGKQEMQDEQIAENADKVCKGIVAVLPRKKDNVSSVMLKFTMTKPVKIMIK